MARNTPTTPFTLKKPYEVAQGRSEELFARVAPGSLDAIVTDPPYALDAASRNGSPRTASEELPYGRHRLGVAGFMGEEWDNGDIAFNPDFWATALQATKPGGYLVAFGGTRTYHRLATAAEDGGWIVRDMLTWLYGQGFPKSRDLSVDLDTRAGYDRRDPHTRAKTAPITQEARRWEGYGTALKPAQEPILLAMRPLQEKTYAGQLLANGGGGLNIDGCRIQTSEALGGGAYATHGSPRASDDGWRMERDGRAGVYQQPSGRWPANILLSHDNNCSEEHGCSPACPLPLIDQQSGYSAGHSGPINRTGARAMDGWGLSSPTQGARHADSGGASRFFYCAKPSTAERNAGLDDLAGRRSTHRVGDPDVSSIRTRLHGSRPRQNFHPTVKPISGRDRSESQSAVRSTIPC